MTTNVTNVPAPAPVESPLSERQQVRVAALRAARDVLVARNLIMSASADPMDLVSVARYIETGEDPWATTQAPAEVSS